MEEMGCYFLGVNCAMRSTQSRFMGGLADGDWGVCKEE